MNKELRDLLKSHPVMWPFIRQAILDYSNRVVEDGLPAWPNAHIISRELWIQLAETCRKELA